MIELIIIIIFLGCFTAIGFQFAGNEFTFIDVLIYGSIELVLLVIAYGLYKLVTLKS